MSYVTAYLLNVTRVTSGAAHLVLKTTDGNVVHAFVRGRDPIAGVLARVHATVPWLRIGKALLMQLRDNQYGCTPDAFFAYHGAPPPVPPIRMLVFEYRRAQSGGGTLVTWSGLVGQDLEHVSRRARRVAAGAGVRSVLRHDVADADIIFSLSEENARLVLAHAVRSANYGEVVTGFAPVAATPAYPPGTAVGRMVLSLGIVAGLVPGYAPPAGALTGDSDRHAFGYVSGFIGDALAYASTFGCLGLLFSATPSQLLDLTAMRMRVDIPYGRAKTDDVGPADDGAHGGVVLEYVTGVHERVVELDFVGCYPTVATTLSTARVHEGDALSAFVLSAYMRQLAAARATAPPFVASLLKFIANATIGVLYQRRSHWYSPRLHSDIITRAATLLTAVSSGVSTAVGATLVGGTVDSCFFACPEGVGVERVREAAERVIAQSDVAVMAVKLKAFEYMWIANTNAYFAVEAASALDAPIGPRVVARGAGMGRKESLAVLGAIARMTVARTEFSRENARVALEAEMNASETPVDMVRRFAFEHCVDEGSADVVFAALAAAPGDATCEATGLAPTVRMFAAPDGLDLAGRSEHTVTEVNIDYYVSRVEAHVAVIEQRLPVRSKRAGDPALVQGGPSGVPASCSDYLAELNFDAAAAYRTDGHLIRDPSIPCPVCKCNNIDDIKHDRAEAMVCGFDCCDGNPKSILSVDARASARELRRRLAELIMACTRLVCTNSECPHALVPFSVLAGEPSVCPLRCAEEPALAPILENMSVYVDQ